MTKVHLDYAHNLRLLKEMIRIRRFEEKCFELYHAQKIRGFLHLYDGEEAVSVGTMQALAPEDAVVATYREQVVGRYGGCYAVTKNRAGGARTTSTARRRQALRRA